MVYYGGLWEGHRAILRALFCLYRSVCCFIIPDRRLREPATSGTQSGELKCAESKEEKSKEEENTAGKKEGEEKEV